MGVRILFFTTLGKHLYDIALHDRFAIKAKSFWTVVFKYKPKLALRRKGTDVGSELTIAQLDSTINKVLLAPSETSFLPLTLLVNPFAQDLSHCLILARGIGLKSPLILAGYRERELIQLLRVLLELRFGHAGLLCSVELILYVIT